MNQIFINTKLAAIYVLTPKKQSESKSMRYCTWRTKGPFLEKTPPFKTSNESNTSTKVVFFFFFLAVNVHSGFGAVWKASEKSEVYPFEVLEYAMGKQRNLSEIIAEEAPAGQMVLCVDWLYFAEYKTFEDEILGLQDFGLSAIIISNILFVFKNIFFFLESK